MGRETQLRGREDTPILSFPRVQGNGRVIERTAGLSHDLFRTVPDTSSGSDGLA